ncbi:MAG: tetratricopeptide repeat protein [FCB group bacterium]|nr:tetratricopeptide repeat protein [FCB group bacterium]
MKYLAQILIVLFLILPAAAEDGRDSLASAEELYLLGQYELLSENYDQAENYFNQALALDSLSSTIYTSLAEIKLNTNDFEAALPLLTKAAALDPEDTQLLTRVLNLYVYLDKAEDAERLVKERLDSDPDNLFLWQSLAELQYNAQKWEDLINSQIQLYLLGDSNVQNLETLIQIGLKTGEFDTMMGALITILKARPDDIQVLGAYIRLLYLIGDDELIHAELKKLAAIVSKPVLVLQQLSLYYEQKKEYARSDSLYAIILADNPDASSYNNYAYNLSTRDNIDRAGLEHALDLVGKALDSEPDNPAYLDTVGWIYFKMGELDLAEYFVLQSLAMEENDADVLLHLGDIYARRNEVQKALEQYNKVLELYPDDSTVLQKIHDLVPDK